MKFRCTVVSASILSVVSGCATHNVKFVPSGLVKVPPSTNATAVEGSIDEGKRLMEQSQLPHNTPRQRFELQRQAGRTLWSQLGSDDSVVLGEVYGGGNAYSNLESLKAAFCKKAAAVGGDVVVIFRTGVEDRPFVYSTPGYSTTTLDYSTHTYGNYTSGSATANTTYTPGQTYASTLHLPYANGLVLKHAPGAEQRRARMAALNDSQLERAIKDLEGLWMSRTVTWDQYVQEAERLVGNAPR
jgi:hypothetical protein